jgi:uncharacterized membrane protein YeiH
MLVRHEICVTAAVLPAGMFVALSLAGLPVWTASAVAISGGFPLRRAAIARGWSLPVYRD